ncbi:gap junction protein delta 6 [Brienomyrus brachyistius]|uniref:gap junction protein delta 6 n=1 Tax=Brienomyrus brachyistius TaxID=42636 RepID=UPI0020B1A0D1|nr:gap junction protein delta 6 [Brienomyrus brachyistius]
MTEWTLLKRLLDAVHQHSTMMGRLWLTVVVVFRLLVVAVAAEDVYADEREMFVCNTAQPGCPNVCYDGFAPISQPRFWVFQIVTVSTPSLCFVIYTWHSLSKRPAGERAEAAQETRGRMCDSDSCSVRSHRHLGHSLVDVLDSAAARGGRQSPGTLSNYAAAPQDGTGQSRVLSKCYVIHVCFRATLELSFVFAQWLLFGFQVPPHYLCSMSPCSQQVDCYVSRPTEKTIFLLFMFCVSVFCIVLNFLELNHLGWKRLKLSSRIPDTWRGYESIAQDSHSTASLTYRELSSTGSLPILDLAGKHRPAWSFTGDCSPLKGEADAKPPSQDDHKGADCLKSKASKGRSAKLRGTEVWI